MAGGQAADAALKPVAKGSWSMAPQSKDANGDGFIDGDGGVPAAGALSMRPSATMVGAGNYTAQPNERLINGSQSWYFPADGYQVILDACASKGSTYSWTVVRADGTTAAAVPSKPMTKCKSGVTLPEGGYTLRLTVKGGGASARSSMPATVRNVVVAAMGDSYSSGEGNPRNIDSYLENGSWLSAFTPYWDDSACERSARSAPAQAALRLEKSSPHFSVTFLDVTCSGATVDAGILGPQIGARQARSQVAQLSALAAGHRIDAITLSIGGNDIGFGAILSACATQVDCPTGQVGTSPLRGYSSVQAGAQGNIAKLPAQYARVQAALASLAPGTPVLPTMYPDITRDADGAPCNYLTMTPADFAWARATLLVPDPQSTYNYVTTSGASIPMAVGGTLNSKIAATESGLGWHPVAGTWGASGNSTIGHGVCAQQQAWTFGLISLGSLRNAAFHPNPQGLASMGKAIADALGSRVS